jgi:hypothetical protein
MEGHEVARLAARAVDTLARLQGGAVLVVWDDASMTTESLGFRGRREAGRLIEPLEAFPAGGLLSYHEVHERLLVACRAHGLLTPPPTGP